MGIYNFVRVMVTCPRCGSEVSTLAEFKLGFCDLTTYDEGDKLTWSGRDQRHRPPNGDADGDGYAECPLCELDFWLVITVRADRIQRPEVDRERPGYIAG
ncbi:MAG TPA: hypothetical protein PLZ93_10945 [Nocardioides sp.]|nr:hypothetical protein [Nocardioides sp.]HRD61883.1 hypothetical protein [Nocardioides sp.]HRI96122.1 hypothetical protein [Nocardioides sp.]HRK45447.1 hypothetical protein [Nocardioides sp.]